MACNAESEFGDRYGWCKEEAIAYKVGDKEYCPFHAPRDKKYAAIGKDILSLTEFNKRVHAKINEDLKNNITCNLSGTIFPGNISFESYNKNNPLPPINVEHAEFWGEASFYLAEFGGKASFYNTKFKNKASFYLAKFIGVASFLGTIFGEEVSFYNAEFGGEARFDFADFGGIALFSSARFTGEASFDTVKFGGKTSFNDAKFGRLASFSFAEFCGVASFDHAEFWGDASFDYAQIKDNAYFRYITIDRKTTFNVRLEKDKEIWFEDVNLKQVQFASTDMLKLHFLLCKWPEHDDRKIVHDELLLDKHPDKNDTPYPRQLEIVQALYRKLKQKHKEMHDEPMVSEWHQGEKEMMRLGAKEEGKSFYYFILTLYKWFSGYGENPRRAFMWLMAIIILAFVTTGYLGVTDVVGQNAETVHYKLIRHYEVRGLDIYTFDTDWEGLGSVLLATLEYITFQKPQYFKPATPVGGLVKIFFQVFAFIQVTLYLFALRNRLRR